MPNDSSTEIVKAQREIAADGRDHRRLMLEEWRLNVQTTIEASRAMESHAVEYAQIGLKSAFLVNAGALVALPPLMQWLPVSQRVLIPTCAWYFVAGLLLAAICSIVAYANFMLLANTNDQRAAALAVELMVNYGLRTKETLEDKIYKKHANVSQRLKPWVFGTMVAALIIGLGSYIAFLWGAVEFRQIVM